MLANSFLYFVSELSNMGINNVSHATTRRGLLRASGVGAIGALAGCLKGFGGGEGGGGLKIGFYGPFSGPASNIGQQKKMAANLSREMINEENGVHGEDITLVFGDSESEPSAGRNEVNRLIQEENVDAVGGGFHSDVALTTIDVTNQHDVPQIIDEAVSSEIVKKINSNNLTNVFKTTPPSQAYAVGWRQLISQFQKQKIGYFPYQKKRIALIGEDTSYGLSIMDLMKGEMNKIGWNVISEDEVGLDETDFTSLLARIQQSNPDIVWGVQTSSSGAGNLAKQFAGAGFENTHFFHNYGLTIEQARQTAGNAANGAITLLNAGRVDKLLKQQGALQAWNKKYDAEMTGSAALSYQNIKLIAEYARSFDDLEAFRSASNDQWAKKVLNHDPVKGGSGYIKFQQNHQAAWGDPQTQSALGYQIIDGNLNFVWPPKLAAKQIDEGVY